MKFTIAVIAKTYPTKFIESLTLLGDIPIIVGLNDKWMIDPPHNVKLFHIPLDQNFAKTRNQLMAKSSTDFVLFVDTDESIDRSLIQEIFNLKEVEFGGYFLKRRDQICGQTLYHGETGNFKIMRLVNKRSGKWQRSVHEYFQTSFPTKTLSNPLIHHKQNFVTGHLERIIFYGPIDTQALFKEGKMFSYIRVFLNPLGKFLQNYLFKLGFLDGTLGLFHAYLMSIQSLSTRIYQWQKKVLDT